MDFPHLIMIKSSSTNNLSTLECLTSSNLLNLALCVKNPKIIPVDQ